MLTAHLQKIHHDNLGQIVRYIVTPAGNIRMFPGFRRFLRQRQPAEHFHVEPLIQLFPGPYAGIPQQHSVAQKLGSILFRMVVGGYQSELHQICKTGLEIRKLFQLLPQSFENRIGGSGILPIIGIPIAHQHRIRFRPGIQIPLDTLGGAFQRKGSVQFPQCHVYEFSFSLDVLFFLRVGYNVQITLRMIVIF